MIVTVTSCVNCACYIVAPYGNVALAAGLRPHRGLFFASFEVENIGGQYEYRKCFERPKR
jgi:hypothetical protein